MSSFNVLVRKITQPVVDHPNADKLTIVTIDGFQCIANKREDGSWRYHEGDYVVYVPEAALVPEWLLKRLDMWNEETGKGMLSGADGNRVKCIRLRQVVSQGLLLPVDNSRSDVVFHTDGGDIPVPNALFLRTETGNVKVSEGDDVTELLGIKKYEPPIPSGMGGDVCNVHGHTMKYDFENIQKVTDMFEDGEQIVACEKLHGTFCCIALDLDLNNEEIFGKGNIFVGSKGLSAQGLVFKNNDANNSNLYVRNLQTLLKNGLETLLHNILSQTGARVIHIFGEIFGRGIQDLGYGTDVPVFRIFDIALDKNFLSYANFTTVASRLQLLTVPTVYVGAYDPSVLTTHRDGKTTLGGGNIREGIVIRSIEESRHPIHGRRIAKMISPAYLLRKSKNGEELTEYQ